MLFIYLWVLVNSDLVFEGIFLHTALVTVANASHIT